MAETTFVFPATKRETTTSLPLTFLDLPFTGPKYVERQFFYNFPHPRNHFYQTTLPSLKHSLSLTLQHFFPLVGNLRCPPPPHKPFILCTQNDALTLTVIESLADFNNLSTNHPKSVKDFSHLVPKLTQKIDFDDNDTLIFSLMALQVSFFPNHGICIAITYCHVMDDYFCNYFMKSWSFIHKKGELIDMKSLPCFDRKVLKDPKGLENILLKGYFEQRETWKNRFLVPSDCRERLGYPIPEGYFGNCLTLCFVAVRRKDLKGEYGFVNAVKAIQNAITEMKNDPLKDAKEWDAMFKKVFMSGNHLLVSGSPKFNVYETDFEFGNPIKVEMMMHSSKDMSLAESGDKDGGLEVGLIFKIEELKHLYSFIEQELEALKF
ncbi:unnamed protein product [Vicia faba]|uniref:Uncharacterized protein n=1 Tax=Vicia faba TaxID=3906 RepID=A0AAV0YJD7_VICFA|nr:unnamed protein product [Vicia faba]